MGPTRGSKRKAIVLSESDDDDDNTTSATRTPPVNRIKNAFEKISPKKFSHGNSSSPETKRVTRQVAKSVVSQHNRKASTSSPQGKATTGKVTTGKAKAKEKKIYSFFNAATQRQQPEVSVSPEKLATRPLDLVDDVIQDDDSLDEDFPRPSGPQDGTVSLGRRKRDSLDVEDSSFSRGSQKFLKPSTSVSNSDGTARQPAATVDQRPWADQYGPIDMEELAVHKRKVQDVSEWLSKVAAGKDRKRLLILRGNAGAGKTTTIKLLSKELGLDIIEWRNPDAAGAQSGLSSYSAQFDDFIARTGTFGTLSLTGLDSDQAKVNPTDIEPRGNFLILIEEFPNTFSRSSSALLSFRNAVLHYLAASTPSLDSLFSRSSGKSSTVVPIVMVISETLLSTVTAASDSFTAHRLLGPDILNHPGVTVFEFNPIAPTFMSKALELVLRKEARKSGRRFAPGPAVLKHLSETGDIRSAVAALEFFCLHSGGEEDWSGKISFTKSRKQSTAPNLTDMERQSLEMITQRESTLGIFHAVGRVVYNRRVLPSSSSSTTTAAATTTTRKTPPPQPPAYLPQHARPNVSEIDIESLLNELGTDIHTFIAALHENYALSCSGLTEEDSLDTVNGCIDSLSDADLLSPDRFSNNSSRYTFQGTTMDNLRQDEISFEASVRGILFNLPHPVKRLNPPVEYSNGRGKGIGKATAYQMYYPTSLRLWRKREHIEGLINQFISKFRHGEVDEEYRSKATQAKAGSVETWKKLSNFNGGLSSERRMLISEEKDDEADTLMVLRGSSKSEMLLERLPYFSAIEKRKPSSRRSGLSKQVDKVTSFSGLTNILSNEEDDNDVEEVESEEHWSTDKPIEDGRKKPRKSVGVIAASLDKGLELKQNIESLVLSDDDIVDDH